jgi:hypothetical protein
LYEQFADEIMDDILELPGFLSFHFSDGLTGIGWGIVYLLKEKFIEGVVDDILFDVDKKLEELDSRNQIFLQDYSLYLSMRKRYSKQNDKEYLSTPNYDERQILEQVWKTCFCQIYTNKSDSL